MRSEGLDRYASLKLYFGHFVFLSFLIFTVLAFKERLFNCDAGYYSFYLVNFEEIFLKHKRYINYLTQFPAWLMIKSDASLRVSLMTYSGTFGILFYGVFLWIAYRLKNLDGGLLLAGSLLLAMRYKHYAGHTEITVAIVFAVLFFCQYWHNIQSQKKHYWLSTLIISSILASIHPVILVPMLMILALDMIYHQRWRVSRAWIQIGILALLMGFRFWLVAKDPYESGKVGFLENLVEVFAKSKEKYVWIILRKYLFEEFYLFYFVLFFVQSCWFLLRKRFVFFGLLHLSHLLLLLMIVVVHSYIRGDVYIMWDGYFAMLGMIWAYSFYEQIKAVRESKIRVLLISYFGVIILSGILIHRSGDFFRKRLAMYEQVFEENPETSKVFVPLSRFDWNQLWYPYEVPMETIMLTSLSAKENSKTIYVDFDKKGMEKLGTRTDFIAFNSKYSLNPKYFDLPKTEYKLVKDVPWKRLPANKGND